MPTKPHNSSYVTSRLPDRYRVDYARAIEVLDVAVEVYLHQDLPFGQADWVLPEEAIALPERLVHFPEERARFFFFSCMFMRGKIKSVQAMKRLMKLYLGEAEAGRPCILDPHIAADMTAEDIGAILKRYGLYQSFGRGWKINAERLLARYGGSVLSIFLGLTTFDEACTHFCNNGRGGGFWGFQKKMTSMMLYYLAESELVTTVNFPPPVDIHHISMAVRVGIIDLMGHTLESKTDLDHGALDDMRDIYMAYSARTNISTATLSKVFWLLSAYLCTQAPGNSLVEHGTYAARRTKARYEPPDFETVDDSVIEAYLMTCGICPVRSFCTKLMPNNQWYDWGVIGAMIAERPVPSPERMIGLLKWHEIGPKIKPIAPPKGPQSKRGLTIPVIQESLF